MYGGPSSCLSQCMYAGLSAVSSTAAKVHPSTSPVASTSTPTGPSPKPINIGSVSVSDMPNWADQIQAWATLASAVLTLAALVAAFLGARAALRANNQQAEQLRQLQLEALERQEQAKQSQAVQICSWIDKELYVFVTNASSQPIYDVKVQYVGSDASAADWEAQVFPPDTRRFALDDLRSRLRNRLIDSLAAREGITLTEYDLTHTTVAKDRIEEQLPSEMVAWAREGVKIEFRDVSGRRWLRDAQGRLSEVPQ